MRTILVRWGGGFDLYVVAGALTGLSALVLLSKCLRGHFSLVPLSAAAVMGVVGADLICPIMAFHLALDAPPAAMIHALLDFVFAFLLTIMLGGLTVAFIVRDPPGDGQGPD